MNNRKTASTKSTAKTVAKKATAKTTTKSATKTVAKKAVKVAAKVTAPVKKTAVKVATKKVAVKAVAKKAIKKAAPAKKTAAKVAAKKVATKVVAKAAVKKVVPAKKTVAKVATKKVIEKAVTKAVVKKAAPTKKTVAKVASKKVAVKVVAKTAIKTAAPAKKVVAKTVVKKAATKVGDVAKKVVTSKVDSTPVVVEDQKVPVHLPPSAIEVSSAPAEPLPESVEAAAKVLFRLRAEKVQLLDLRGQSDIADYFLLGTCGSEAQMQAILNNLQRDFKSAHIENLGIEYRAGVRWAVFDGIDVMVHLFEEGARNEYSLDRLWRDGKEITLNPESFVDATIGESSDDELV